MAGAHLGRDFFDLIKCIGEAKSKQEEDRIIVIEVNTLKKLLQDRTLVGKRLREFLIRLVYVEMLGHDASFGYMKTVELSASSNLTEKRVAYLTAALCFSPDHEFRMMLVNRLQRDLQSANVLEASIALSAAAKLLTTDMIPAVLPIIANLLKHDQEIIRKKAVMLLQRFHSLQADSVSTMGDKFRRALCDRDPSVMGASLHLFLDLAKGDPSAYKDLVSSFVSILKQITEHRLPRDFDYHRIPAPWIQMKLLRILAHLGRADGAASEQMYEVLLDVMRRADTGINVGYAIVYECVRTVTTIYPNATLLDAAAASIGRFIGSDNHNLKYLGVTGLAAIVKDHPRYAAEHQLAVIDCLEDPDDTLKRKTLDLLYRMINPVNVGVIVDKLLAHLRAASDTYLRTDLVTRITAAAERFAPSNSWYIGTMTTVFELGGDLVRPEVSQNLIRLVAEGAGESEAADEALRREAVITYCGLLEHPSLPDVLLQVLFWVLGEYGYLCVGQSVRSGTGDHAREETITLPFILEKVCALAQRAGLESSTRGYALSAALKLSAQIAAAAAPSAPPAFAAGLLGRYGSSRHVDLAQRCHEMEALAARPALAALVLPVDASTEDIDVDEGLGFLGGYVQSALSAGAKTYAPPKPDHGDGAGEDEGSGAGGARRTAGGLIFEEYKREEPALGSLDLPGGGGDPNAINMQGGPFGGPPGGGFGGPGSGAPGSTGPATIMGGKNAGMWGKKGFVASGAGDVLGTAPSAAQAAVPPGTLGGYPGYPPSGAAAAQQQANGGGAQQAPPAQLSPADAALFGGLSGPPAPGASRRPWDSPSSASSGSSSGGGGGYGGVPGPAAAPAAPPEPPKPREPTEKEKQAALFFAGTSSAPSSSSGGGGAGAGRRGGAPASTSTAAPAPSPSAGAAFKPGGGGAAAAPTARASPVPAPAPAPAPVHDLLDIFAPSPAPAPAAASFRTVSGGPTSTSGGGMGGGLGDLFAPAPAPTPFQQQQQFVGGGDMFSSMGASSSSSASGASGLAASFSGLNMGGSSAPGGAASMMGGQLFGAAPSSVGGFTAPVVTASLSLPPPLASSLGPTRPDATTASNPRCGGSEAALALHAHKLFGDAATHIAIFVVNHSATAEARGVNVTIAAPGGGFLAIAGLRGPAGAVPTAPAGGQLALGSIPPRGHVACVVSLALSAMPPAGAGAPGAVCLTGSISSSAAAPVPFSVELPLSDVLRPAPLDTAAFGAYWTNPALGADGVISVAGSGSIRTPQDFMARVGSALNVHPVQMIEATSEAIAAGRLMGSPNAIVLLHARVLPGTLECRLKSADPGLSAALCATAAARLR